MILKYNSLEAYYLNRRLELLHILDQYAEESLTDEDFDMDDDHWKLQMLRKQYSDVIDPENLCSTLRQIYPDHLFGIESRRTNRK